jgi:hypothetical protein
VAKLQIPRRLRLAHQALNGAASRPFGKDALSQGVSIACEYLEGWACTKIQEEPNYGKISIQIKDKFRLEMRHYTN